MATRNVLYTPGKIVLGAVLLVGAMIAAAEDVSYTEKPETEPVVVATGDSAETLGARLLRCHRPGIESFKHMPQQRQCNSLV